MPPGMIISNGMGGFIQYPQTISPFGAMQFSQAGAHQLAQMGQMQMILQPAMNIRHVSIKILCTYLWCLTHKISWKDHIPWVIWLKQRKIKQNLLLDFRKKDFRIVFPYLYDSFGLTWFVSPPQPPPPLEGHRELNNRFVSNIFFLFLVKNMLIFNLQAKPVGRTPIPRTGGISGSQGTGLSDQSGAGKVKKKKPSPSARRRSRLR